MGDRSEYEVKEMSETDLEDIFVSFVKRHLEPLTNSLKSALSTIKSSEFDERVTVVRFEIFGDGFTECLPISVYYLDANRSECGICEIQPLVDVAEVFPYDDELFDRCEDAGVDVFQTASHVCRDWFVGCWNEVESSAWHLDAEIAIHDRSDTVKL